MARSHARVTHAPMSCSIFLASESCVRSTSRSRAARARSSRSPMPTRCSRRRPWVSWSRTSPIPMSARSPPTRCTSPRATVGSAAARASTGGTSRGSNSSRIASVVPCRQAVACTRMRREIFEPSTLVTGTDDFVLSTQAVRAGKRIAFDAQARVLVAAPEDSGTELHRKVRVMNRRHARRDLVGVVAPASRSDVSLPTHLSQDPASLRRVLPRRPVRRASRPRDAGPRRVVVQRWPPNWSSTRWRSAARSPTAPDGTSPSCCGFPTTSAWRTSRPVLAVLSLLRGRKYEMWEPALGAKQLDDAGGRAMSLAATRPTSKAR